MTLLLLNNELYYCTLLFSVVSPPHRERVCTMGISVLTAEKEFSVTVARASGQILGTGEARKMNQNNTNK